MGGRGGVANFFVVAGLILLAVGLFARRDGTAAGTSVGYILMMIGGIWALVGIGLRFLYAGMGRRVRAEQQQFESGTKATAVVESVETTGTVLNNINMQIHLRLRIQPRSEPEFVHERTMFVPVNGVPRVGDLIDVAYDPNDTSKVALDTEWQSNTGGGRLLNLRRAGDAASSAYQLADAGFAGSTASERVIEQLERLHGLKQEGALTDREYELQKAKILSEQIT